MIVATNNVQTFRQAVAFALEKLSNEVDREFDGADVGASEKRGYKATIPILQAFVEPSLNGLLRVYAALGSLPKSVLKHPQAEELTGDFEQRTQALINRRVRLGRLIQVADQKDPDQSVWQEAVDDIDARLGRIAVLVEQLVIEVA